MKQILAVTLLNLRNLPSRLGASLVIVVGIAGVVGVLVAMLSMSRGFDKTLAGTGSDQRALLLSAGVLAELSSYVGPDVVSLVRDLPGVARDAQGRSRVSAELMVITEVKRGLGGVRGASVNVALRGVEAAGLAMRPEVKLVEGRLFTPGLRELIAGRKAQQQFQGVAVGQVLHFRGSEWTVTGIFTSNDDAHESELWTDADTARGAFGRPGASSILAQLDSGGMAALKAALAGDQRLQMDAQTEKAYFTSQSANFTERIGVLTAVLSTLMAIGALFGALNTMYSAVSTREVEIATLRAIGFSGTAMVVSVLAEALLLALLGGLGGALIAYVLFNGMTVSTLGQNFTQVAFSFVVTPDLISKGVNWALLIGLLGGLAPALRAARLPVIEALRAH